MLPVVRVAFAPCSSCPLLHPSQLDQRISARLRRISAADDAELNLNSSEEQTVKKKVEFEAHKVVKKPTDVAFKTHTGKTVDFVASKKTKVPVHVKFKAQVKK
jgi:hypothetical protein